MSDDYDKIESALEGSDKDCEGANYHDRVGLARDVFNAVKTLVQEANHVKLALKIRKAVEP